MKDGFADRTDFVFSAKVSQLNSIARHERTGQLKIKLSGDFELIKLVFCDGDAINGINPDNARIQNKSHREMAHFARDEDSLARR